MSLLARGSSFLLKPAVCLLLGASAVLYSRPADAAVIINATESGGNVVFDYSGSLDVSGFNPGNSTKNTALVSPSASWLYSPGSSGSFVYCLNVF